MSDQPRFPGSHDPNLINRRPISQVQWSDAWRIATDHPRCRPVNGECAHAHLEPQLRWPAAQVGICRVGRDRNNPDRYPGCQGEIIPTALPHFAGAVIWFESRCVRCGTEFTDHDQTSRPSHAASAAQTEPARAGGHA